MYLYGSFLHLVPEKNQGKWIISENNKKAMRPRIAHLSKQANGQTHG